MAHCEQSMFSVNDGGGGGCYEGSVAGESVTRVTPRDESRNSKQSESNRCSHSSLAQTDAQATHQHNQRNIGCKLALTL